jgi:hypothetical protein
MRVSASVGQVEASVTRSYDRLSGEEQFPPGHNEQQRQRSNQDRQQQEAHWGSPAMNPARRKINAALGELVPSKAAGAAARAMTRASTPIQSP